MQGFRFGFAAVLPRCLHPKADGYLKAWPSCEIARIRSTRSKQKRRDRPLFHDRDRRLDFRPAPLRRLRRQMRSPSGSGRDRFRRRFHSYVSGRHLADSRCFRMRPPSRPCRSQATGGAGSALRALAPYRAPNPGLHR